MKEPIEIPGHLRGRELYLDPQPRIWPACPVCSTPYVLRRALLSFTGSPKLWSWAPDCKGRECKPRTGRPAPEVQYVTREELLALEAADDGVPVA